MHTVDVAQRTSGVPDRGDGGHVRAGAEHITGRSHRKQPGPLPDQLAVLVDR